MILGHNWNDQVITETYVYTEGLIVWNFVCSPFVHMDYIQILQFLPNAK